MYFFSDVLKKVSGINKCAISYLMNNFFLRFEVNGYTNLQEKQILDNCKREIYIFKDAKQWKKSTKVELVALVDDNVVIVLVELFFCDVVTSVDVETVVDDDEATADVETVVDGVTIAEVETVVDAKTVVDGVLIADAETIVDGVTNADVETVVATVTEFTIDVEADCIVVGLSNSEKR
ncbi:unnamed protein product [Adineta steineri]|uniref:Uncharacterized protein n=1 Tax=Adineta steineri TaxID=433720 RepID=A0A819U6F9_9BILA|nr:unnamed protein product [Adineta steineri]